MKSRQLRIWMWMALLPVLSGLPLRAQETTPAPATPPPATAPAADAPAPAPATDGKAKVAEPPPPEAPQPGEERVSADNNLSYPVDI